MGQTTLLVRAPRSARDWVACIFCGRSYHGTAARPRWAYNHQGQLVGSVHASHEQHEGKAYPYWTAPGELEPENARFVMWLFHICPIPADRHSDEHLAWMLGRADGATLDGRLSQQQLGRLEWWLDPTSQLGIGPERKDGILAAYARLLEHYTEWRTKLEE